MAKFDVTSVPRWFTNRMRCKLIQNSHKDPDRVPGGADFWIDKLHEEVSELQRAIDAGDFQKILTEAADVANVAMLTARWYKP